MRWAGVGTTPLACALFVFAAVLCGWQFSESGRVVAAVLCLQSVLQAKECALDPPGEGFFLGWTEAWHGRVFFSGLPILEVLCWIGGAPGSGSILWPVAAYIFLARIEPDPLEMRAPVEAAS